MKGRKIFVGTDNMGHAAYFGWQDKGQALYGLREGYKNSADDLVSLVISSNCDSKTLDTYIFPIMFLYRHSLEISLKHIYQRCYGELPEGGHDLLTLWFTVKRDVIDKFFNSFGKVVYVDEKLMDGIVCASGSSPAYVYMFIEAMADSVVKYGIKRDDAYKLVAQTVLGSAKMVLESGEHPAVLKDKVCSPGGTTIQAVSALEENGFRNALIKATDACYDKCTSIK